VTSVVAQYLPSNLPTAEHRTGMEQKSILITGCSSGIGIRVSIIEPGPIESRFRANAYAAFKRNIDREHSVYRDYYARVEKRLAGPKPMPFTLPPQAVQKKVIRALEARRPKARYGVTFPTHFFAVLRRVLPVRVRDQILSATSNGERRGYTPPEAEKIDICKKRDLPRLNSLRRKYSD
jgi:short-subunit dehydrogenase